MEQAERKFPQLLAFCFGLIKINGISSQFAPPGTVSGSVRDRRDRLNVKRWNDALLDGMRKCGDPAADTAVAAVMAQHSIERVNEILRSLVRNDEIAPHEMPEVVRHYLDGSSHLPPWADKAMIERGEAFFDDNWPVIVMLLFCASLPSAYAASNGAQVLHLTKRMSRHVHRRIFETAQFILDVMAPGGLSGHGRGVRSAQKVRLMHSAIRQMIEHDARWRKHWDDAWGVPINQEDLAGTLMTFSFQILDGMKRFGIAMSRADEEAYLHAWKVTGYLMGIDEALLPADMDDAQALATTIFERQMRASVVGVELTSALLTFMQAQLPGRWMDGLPATLVRQSIDRDVADLLNVPPANWTVVLFRMERALFRLMGRFNARHHSRLLQWLSYQVVQELVKIERGGERGLFRIPPTLRAPV